MQEWGWEGGGITQSRPRTSGGRGVASPLPHCIDLSLQKAHPTMPSQ